MHTKPIKLWEGLIEKIFTAAFSKEDRVGGQHGVVVRRALFKNGTILDCDQTVRWIRIHFGLLS